MGSFWYIFSMSLFSMLGKILMLNLGIFHWGYWHLFHLWGFGVVVSMLQMIGIPFFWLLVWICVGLIWKKNGYRINLLLFYYSNIIKYLYHLLESCFGNYGFQPMAVCLNVWFGCSTMDLFQCCSNASNDRYSFFLVIGINMCWFNLKKWI